MRDGESHFVEIVAMRSNIKRNAGHAHLQGRPPTQINAPWPLSLGLVETHASAARGPARCRW